MGRIPDKETAIRCLNQIPKLLAIYEPESPKLREDVIDSIELLARPTNDAKKRLIFKAKKSNPNEYYVSNKKGDFLGDIAHEDGMWKLIILPLSAHEELWYASDCLREIADFLEVCKQSEEG